MAVKIQSVDEVVVDTGIKILVHSMAGVGKTVLCATAQEPTLIINAESGMLSLAQNKYKLQAEGSPTFDPSYCKVATIKTLDELSEIYDMLEADLQSDKPAFQWVCLDSITEIAEVCLKNELSKSRDPRAAYGQLQSTVLDILKAYRDLLYYDVLFSCKQQRVTDNETGVTSYLPMMPGSKLHQQIPYIFDEVFALRVGKDEDGDPFTFIQAVRDIQYEAKDRSGALSDCEPPSLKMIKEKIRSAVDYSPEHAVEEEQPVDEPADEEQAVEEKTKEEKSEPKTSKKINLDVPDDAKEVVDDA